MSQVSADSSLEAEMEAADDAGVRARLAKEVAAWSAERSGRVQIDTDPAPAEVKQAPRPAKPAAKRATKPAQPKPASAAPNKPFSMSYDGVTSREYMDQVIARGTR
jgi:hypothetical protein